MGLWQSHVQLFYCSMDYCLDESKRILIIEKDSSKGERGLLGGMRPETGGGATNTPGEEVVSKT